MASFTMLDRPGQSWRPPPKVADEGSISAWIRLARSVTVNQLKKEVAAACKQGSVVPLEGVAADDASQGYGKPDAAGRGGANARNRDDRATDPEVQDDPDEEARRLVRLLMPRPVKAVDPAPRNRAVLVFAAQPNLRPVWLSAYSDTHPGPHERFPSAAGGSQGEHGVLASVTGSAPLGMVWRMGRDGIGGTFVNEGRIRAGPTP